METFQSVLSLITPGCYWASLDLKDSSYSVPVATLRFDGHIIAIHIDDLINVGLTFDECVENFITSIMLLNSLGFIIHPDKSTSTNL